jgi:NitT/TauT family transport system permease protein
VADHSNALSPVSGEVRVIEKSDEYRAYLDAIRHRAFKVKLWQVAILVGFIAMWEIAPRSGWVDPMLTSYPSAVLKTFSTLMSDNTLLVHTWGTLRSTLIGFVGGMAIGTGVAVALWLSSFLHRILDPFIVVLNALPKIALVPIYYIWLGDLTSIYAMAITISVFVTIIMLYTGFQAIDPDKIKLVQLFGASRLQTLTKIVLPGSVPTMISTLKVNIGLTLVGVIVGEFQAARIGLGHLIIYGSQIFAMNVVMTSIVVLAVISTLLFAAIQVLEKFINHRRGQGG